MGISLQVGHRQCSKIKTVSCPPIKVNIFATANISTLINLLLQLKTKLQQVKINHKEI